MSRLDKMVKMFETGLTDIKSYLNDKGVDTNALENEVKDIYNKLKTNLTRKDRLQLARHQDRPYTMDYIESLFTDFSPCSGDRKFSEDKSIVSGFAKYKDQTVAIVGHQKGRNTKERQMRNFGMPQPEGYRKAARVFHLAERFQVPLITFIDTPGAYPGIGAEERGQAVAIAENLEIMSGLTVPSIAFVTGEGGSGGALALGVTNEVHILEHATYSVISAEPCSSILYREQTPETIDKAIEALKFCSDDIHPLGIVHSIIPEGLGAHKSLVDILPQMEERLDTFLAKFAEMSGDEIIDDRLENFRQMGVYDETSS
jgi:acetyl-CoA carboxylase carboxyl transferase subunit alpha